MIGLSGAAADGRTVQAAEVLAAIEAGEPANFDGCTIIGNLDLSKLEIKGPVYFNNSAFKDDAKFIGATFKDDANFESAKFDGIACFSSATFNRAAEFLNAEFNVADFQHARFNSHANFVNAQFNIAYFQYATFMGKAIFGTAKFKGNSRFTNAKFNGSAYFWEAKFDDNAVFQKAEFSKTVDFKKAKFNYTADFQNTVFNGSSSFKAAQFNGYVEFQNATFNISDFTEARFNSVAHFNSLFEGDATFESASFKDYALFEKAKFYGTLSLTRTRYDRLFIRWHNIIGGLVYDDTAYITLMKNFKDLGFYEDYDNCYFSYRKEHRAQDWQGIPDWDESIRKGIDRPLEWFYGYGTKPFNAFFISVVIIIIFTIFWWAVGLGGQKDNTHTCLKEGEKWCEGDLIDILAFSATVFLSGTRFFIDPPEIPKIEGRSRSTIKVAFIVERVLGALFSVLFFIAISSTIVRAS